MNIKKIKKGDMFYNEGSGFVYRLLGRHFSDYYCEATDEYNENGEPINFKPCYVTASELRVMAGAKVMYVDDESDE